MLARIAAWWVSSSASKWGFGIAAVLAIGLFWYVEELRVFKQKCLRAQADQAQYMALADRLAKELEIDRDAAIKRIQDSDNPCLDLPVDELWRD